MRKYITLVGRSYWATLNSLWAVIKEDKFRPEEIILLAERSVVRRAKVLKRDIERLLDGYEIEADISIELLDDADFNHAGEDVEKIMGEDGENEVALDITGGRKSLVAGALVNSAAKHFKHVFYLYLDELDDASKPYPNINQDRMMVKDFVGIYRNTEIKEPETVEGGEK